MRTMIVKVNVCYRGDSTSQCRKVNVKEIFKIQRNTKRPESAI